VAYACIGLTLAIALKNGQAAEQAMQRMSQELGRQSTLEDLGAGGNNEAPYSIKIAHLNDTIMALEAVMPHSTEINTLVNGARVKGGPHDITLKKLGKVPKYIFEGSAPDSDDEEEGEGAGLALRQGLRGAESYGFSGPQAVHPRARKQATAVTSHIALLHPAGPMGWASISGALELDEDYEPGGVHGTPPGSCREDAITLSSGEGGGAPDGAAHSTPTHAAGRRKLDMPSGLARGLAGDEPPESAQGGREVTPARRPRRTLQRCATVGRRGSPGGVADATRSPPAEGAQPYCPVCEGPAHGPESPDCLVHAAAATTRAREQVSREREPVAGAPLARARTGMSGAGAPGQRASLTGAGAPRAPVGGNDSRPSTWGNSVAAGRGVPMPVPMPETDLGECETFIRK